MATLVTDPDLEKRLQTERAVAGADRYDEVWEGIYMMAPMPDDEHQQIVNRLAAIFQDIIDWPGLGDVRPGVNVSDREKGWQHNYRVPDVAVFLKGGPGENRGAFWHGGPDFAVEIVSRADQSREKRPFYAKVGVRELLVIDRNPWQLELYRLQDGDLVEAGTAEPQRPRWLDSAVLPFRFRLVSGSPRPQIEVEHVESAKTWLV